MMPVVFVIPGALRQFTGGQTEIRLPGHVTSVSEALALLYAEFPGVRDRIVNERHDVRTHINIFVDGENVRHLAGLASPVRDGAEIVILPAVSGGR